MESVMQISQAIYIVITHIFDKENLERRDLLKLLQLFGVCKELRNRIRKIKHFTISDWYFTGDELTEHIETYKYYYTCHKPIIEHALLKYNERIKSVIAFLNNLTELETLDASGTNDIDKILKYTRLPNLTKLTLQDTNYESRTNDIEKLLEHTTLTLDTNDLHEYKILDSHKRKTQPTQIGNIVLSFSKLTYLKFSHQPVSANELVFCLPNLLHLRTLNISYCNLEQCAKKLKDIFKLLTHLNYLDVSHNSDYTEDILLAITSLINLETLIYELNDIVSLSVAHMFCASLNALINLKTLSLKEIYIELECMHVLAENLNKQTLESLNLSNIEYYSDQRETFILWTRILTNMSNLTHLNLECNYLRLNDITSLITAFNNLTKLQKLNLSSNLIDVDSLSLLSYMITQLPKLTVNLYNNFFQQKDETEWRQFINPQIHF